MSTLWWAGVAIDPQTQGEAAADELNAQIEDMLIALGTEPFASILEPDGSEICRYDFNGRVLSDFRDRTGRRIGFGIQASDENDAREHIASVQTLLVHWDVDALASIWTWCHMEAHHPAPQELTIVA